MQIRKATTDDASTIKEELSLPAFREDEQLDPGFNDLDEEELEEFGCEYWLEDEDRTMFIAEIDGRLVGHISVVKVETPPIYKRGSRAHIDGLYVKDDYRKEGIASSLIERVERWAKAKNCDTIGVTVHKQNDKARALYERDFALKLLSYRRRLE